MFKFFQRRKKDPKKALKELLNGFELPSFTQTVMNALKKLRDPDVSLSEVANEIEKDPGMHVMVLKCVNSAAFGLRKKVSNVGHAVNLLGRSRLESLILPLAVRESIPKIKAPCLNMRRFWFTSGFRASLARRIAEELHPVSKDDSFTAALLQDIAVPVLIASKQDEYCLTLDEWDEVNGKKLPELERKRFGFDHQTIGGFMAEQWEFPDNLKTSILTHHYDDRSHKVPTAVRIVASIRYLNTMEPFDELEVLKATCSEDYCLSGRLLDEMAKMALDDAEEMAALME